MPLAYIALGSNLGDRVGQMREAFRLLESNFPVEALRSSPIYQNRPVGMGEGAPDFLNAVVEVRTSLEPLDLLKACLDTELQLGRVRSSGKWTPRTIDLDLLDFDSISINTDRLVLPHPRIAERDFVAVPFSELAPDLKIYGKPLSTIVSEIAVIELQLTKHILITSNT
ncbi:MAG: 2-amino-4-hydroxy-6-hydroxymethyldihydropteridine diphosphokinase [Verrucomicrobiota bacterium]